LEKTNGNHTHLAVTVDAEMFTYRDATPQEVAEGRATVLLPSGKMVIVINGPVRVGG
jgi:hypothetical protein